MAIDRLGGPRGFNPADRLDPAATKPGNQADRAGEPGTDRVEVSSTARSIARLSEQVQALPDLRRQRVDELRRSVEDGTYRVDARRVARDLLEFEDGIGE